jgi:hypothetical protein
MRFDDRKHFKNRKLTVSYPPPKEIALLEQPVSLFSPLIYHASFHCLSVAPLSEIVPIPSPSWPMHL